MVAFCTKFGCLQCGKQHLTNKAFCADCEEKNETLEANFIVGGLFLLITSLFGYFYITKLGNNITTIFVFMFFLSIFMIASGLIVYFNKLYLDNRFNKEFCEVFDKLFVPKVVDIKQAKNINKTDYKN